MDNNVVYACAENMIIYALNKNTGAITLSKHVQGQSFYSQWPVVFSSFVFVSAAMIPCLGAEWCGEIVITSATDVNHELDLWLQWLTTTGMGDASPDWKHLTVLSRTDFTEPFTAIVPPFEGCGEPPEPPIIDNQNRVLTYYHTKFPKLTQRTLGTVPPGTLSVFGTNGSVDIVSLNLTNGRITQIDNGASNFSTMQLDNGFGLTCGGNYIYLRNGWFGNSSINLTTSLTTAISGPGGGGSYRSGRVSPSVSGTALFYPGSNQITAVEHY
jgi:hypothetical protein